MKKCPPGVLCIENMSIFYVFVLIVILFFVMYNTIFKPIVVNNHNDNRNTNPPNNNPVNRDNSSWFLPSYPYTNLGKDVLLDPYVPPLSDDRYFVPQINRVPPGTMPINVSTNVGAVDTNYRQMGILTALSTKGKICALMGRPLFTNRDKWQYYTMSDQYNSIKLPISRNGKSCTNEYGCDRLFDGDSVYIEGINEAYKVTIYDNDTIRYIPAL